MTTKPKITNELVCDLYDRSNRIRRLVCNMHFSAHDHDARERLLLEALDDLESLDGKISIVGDACDSDETIHLVDRAAAGGVR